MRTLVGFGFLLATGWLAGGAVADGIAPDAGIEALDRAKIRTTITPAGDVDDAYFVGLPGQRVRAVLRTEPRGDEPELFPRLSLLDPDGQAVWSSTDVKLKLDVVLESAGTYTLRVEGTVDGAVGRYRLDVKHTAPRYPKATRDIADPGPGAFDVSAGPGVELGFVLAWRRGDLEFNGITDPDGNLVPLLEDEVQEKKGKIRLRPTALPGDAPAGVYRVHYWSSSSSPAEKLRFVPKIRLERLRGKARKLDLAPTEPRILLAPPGAVPGERLSLQVLNPLDPDDEALPRVFLSGRDLLDVDVASSQFVSALVPVDFPLGLHRPTVRTHTGQVATWNEDVELVLRPRVTSILPGRGPESGGFEVELRGTQFPSSERLGVTLNGFVLSSVTVLESGPDRVRFLAPPRGPGNVSFGVVDRPSEIGSRDLASNFVYEDIPALDAVEPSITPHLGGEGVVLRGAGFEAGDRVLLERPDGSFETIPNTFVSGTVHRFDAPARPAGRYVVTVENADGHGNPIERTLRYFRFTDITAAAGLDQIQGDVLAAVASTTVDYDGDDDLDLILCSAGGDAASARSLTRVLRNDDGVFTDVTIDVLPPVTASEDWRAHAVSTADVDGDGRPDLFLASNHEGVLAHNSSHLRVLRNVRVGPTTHPSVRRFVDATMDWMPIVRGKAPFSFNNEPTEVADAWRATDMWVGDLDGDGGVPDVVIVHDEVKNEPNTQCLNYCTSPLGSGATYNFYWGGTRVFRWDAAQRDGLGRFYFAENAMPRRSGIGVPLLIPGGGVIIGCFQPCIGKFTPFTGERLVVDDFDGDGRLDIAVVTTATVIVDGEETSSLQVALNHPDSSMGSEVTDVTRAVAELGGSFRARSVAFGRVQGPYARGALAITSPAAPNDGSRAMRLVRLVESGLDGETDAAFEELTSLLPPVAGGAALQADALRMVDVDGNGRDDIVLLSNDTAPLNDAPGLRLVLSQRLSDGGIRLVKDWESQLTPLLGGDEDLAGATLTIGDLAGGGLPTFVISRATSTGAATETRLVEMTAGD